MCPTFIPFRRLLPFNEKTILSPTKGTHSNNPPQALQLRTLQLHMERFQSPIQRIEIKISEIYPTRDPLWKSYTKLESMWMISTTIRSKLFRPGRKSNASLDPNPSFTASKHAKHSENPLIQLWSFWPSRGPSTQGPTYSRSYWFRTARLQSGC